MPGSRVVPWLAAMLVATSCGRGSAPTTPNQPAAGVQRVDVSAVSGDTVFLASGQTRQLQATVHFSNGASQVATAGVTWQSANAMVASVSASGLVTAVAPGTAGITATYQGVRSASSWVAQVRVAPNLAGTWSGTYSALVRAGVGGIFTVTLAPNGDGAFVGTFVVEDDLHLGRITGTFFGRFRPYPNERQLDFAFSAPKGNMTREPSCGLLVSGLATMNDVSRLVSQYTGNWCDGPLGLGFSGFDGALDLQRR